MTTPVFEDGYYSSICPREKVKRTFYGTVRYTDGGRVIAEGPCPNCGTLMSKILYTG